MTQMSRHMVITAHPQAEGLWFERLRCSVRTANESGLCASKMMESSVTRRIFILLAAELMVDFCLETRN